MIEFIAITFTTAAFVMLFLDVVFLGVLKEEISMCTIIALALVVTLVLVVFRLESEVQARDSVDIINNVIWETCKTMTSNNILNIRKFKRASIKRKACQNRDIFKFIEIFFWMPLNTVGITINFKFTPLLD